MSDFGGEHATGGDPSAPAGWYPVDGGQQRYWDGSRWTEHIAPLAGPTGAPAPAAGVDDFAGSDPFRSDPMPGGAVPFTAPNHPVATAITDDDRTMAVLIHVLAIFTGFLGPLIVWLIKRDQSVFVDHHGKEALNLQITLFLAWIVTFLAVFVLIGLLFIPFLLIIGLLFPILAAVAANRGEFYRFPAVIRFLR